MGRYRTWTVTGTPPGPEAQHQALKLAETYDETLNEIPGGWPGLSFDFIEPDYRENLSVPDALELLERGEPPAALITPDGQITSLDNHWNLPAEEYVNLIAGDECLQAMKRALLEHPEQAVTVMEWHT